MSLYRTLLAAVAAVAIASPVFADDNSMQTQPSDNNSATMTDQQSSASSSSMEENKLNLNKASAKELMKVKGINAAKARAIVAYRKKHAFTTTDELTKVKGFKKLSPEKLKSIQDQVSVD